MACKRVVISLIENSDGLRASIEAMDRKSVGKTAQHVNSGRQVLIDPNTKGLCRVSNSDGQTVLVPEDGDLYQKIAAVLPQMFANCRNVRKEDKQ